MQDVMSGRRWVVLLFLYVLTDFADPSVPGVFFFDTEQLFLDGVVSKTATSPGQTAVSGKPGRVALGEAPQPQPHLPERLLGGLVGSLTPARRLHAKYTYPPPVTQPSSEDH